MTPQESSAFRAFTDSFQVTDRESLENYNLQALFALQGQEREQAEQILIDRLSQTDDPRAPRALLALRSSKALPFLRQALQSQEGEMLVEVANTLWVLSGNTAAIAPLLRVLAEGELYSRVSAAYILREFPPEAVTGALFQAVNDEDKLVRTNVVGSLYSLYGLHEWEQVPGRGVMLLGLGLRSNYSSIRREALKKLTAIIEGKKAGKSAQELGVTIEATAKSPAATAFLQSLVSPADIPPWDEDFDLAALDKLQGEEIEWAKYSMLNYLEKHDFRAVRALVHLHCVEAIEPLQEALREAPLVDEEEDYNGSEERFRTEATQGIKQLTAVSAN